MRNFIRACAFHRQYLQRRSIELVLSDPAVRAGLLPREVLGGRELTRFGQKFCTNLITLFNHHAPERVLPEALIDGFNVLDCPQDTSGQPAAFPPINPAEGQVKAVA